VNEVIHECRGQHLHIAALAGINEDIGFNLRQVAEEAVNILRRA
jgi:hypothetical protein